MTLATTNVVERTKRHRERQSRMVLFSNADCRKVEKKDHPALNENRSGGGGRVPAQIENKHIPALDFCMAERIDWTALTGK
jgi:hypothetical protein